MNFLTFNIRNKMLRILVEYQKTKLFNKKKRIGKKQSRIKQSKDCIQIWKAKNPETRNLIIIINHQQQKGECFQ